MGVEWYTPPSIFKKLGVRFDLDPCSPGADVVTWIPAMIHYTKADDGLLKQWFGNVWLNPPYGKNTKDWLLKFREHGHGVALQFSRTDTRWFHEVAAYSDLIYFVKRRIIFIAGDGQSADRPGAPSVLIAYGRDNAKALLKSNLGLCVKVVK